jgi:hypothetical protein
MNDKKSSSRRFIALGIVIVLIIAIVAIIVTQMPSSTKSPFVNVSYRVAAWYKGAQTESNNAYLLLNLTITNNGYTNGVEIYQYNPLALEGWGLNISNTVYAPSSIGTIYNASDILGYSMLYPTLASTLLLNNGTTSGTILFEVPLQQYESSFNLLCAIATKNGATTTDKITQTS